MPDSALFVDTELPSPITEFALQVTSNLQGRDHYASGTAVIVSPYLAFGARHVLEEHHRRHTGDRMSLIGELKAGFSFVLLQVIENRLYAWAVTRLWSSGITDIVLLRLSPYSPEAHEYKFRHLTIDLKPPQIGESIHAFGYCENVVEQSNPIKLRQRAVTTHGRVVEVHHQRRDSATMPFPCFQTNARFDGGMSGGPVFNDSGALCGLVCSSYPPFAAEEEHASFAVALWPAMAIPLDLDRVGHPPNVRYRLFDLVKDGILVARNTELVEVGPLSDVGTPQVSFRLP